MFHIAGSLLARGWIGLLVACVQPPAASQPADTLIFEIAAERRPCVGEAVQQCLVVRQAGDTDWVNLYDLIEGFTHEDGYRYRVEVERTVVPNPPADGSRYRYRLLRTLSRERGSATHRGR